MEQQNILLKQKKMCGSERPMSDVVVMCGQKDCCGEISIWEIIDGTCGRSGLAQRKRVGPITQRSEDRNLHPLNLTFPFLRNQNLPIKTIFGWLLQARARDTVLYDEIPPGTLSCGVPANVVAAFCFDSICVLSQR
jgi:hypothetical protein